MKALKIVLLAILPLFWAGCASQQNVHNPVALESSASKVRKGMTKAQVESILGPSQIKQTLNGRETWVYTASDVAAQGRASSLTAIIPVVGPFMAVSQRSKTTVTDLSVVVSFNTGGRVSKVDQSKMAGTGAGANWR